MAEVAKEVVTAVIPAEAEEGGAVLEGAAMESEAVSEEAQAAEAAVEPKVAMAMATAEAVPQAAGSGIL